MTTPRDRLLECLDNLSVVFRELDEVGPRLAEPERTEARQVRDDIARAMRRLSAVAAMG
jgi:hypothetical protein